jgi:zinc protease
VAAFQSSAELGGQFWITATARPGGDLAALERAVGEELARFLRDGPTRDELERARTAFLSDYVRGLERIGGFGGKSDVLASSQVYGGSPDFYRAQLARLAAATPAQVTQAARRWLSDGDLVLSVTPFPAADAAAPPGPDRSRPPAAGEPADPRFPAFSRHRLPNGLQVLVAERHAVPVVAFDLLVDAGYASDAGGLAGTARLAGELLTDGTRTRSALQLSDEAQRLGARLGASSNLDLTTVHLSALRSRLDPSLALLADVVLHPTFPAADFARRQKLLLAAIEREASDPTSLAMRVMPGLLYGPGHAYANPLSGSGTRDSVSRLSREDVVRWHERWFRPGSATLVVTGDTTAAEILPRLEKLFSGWKAGQAPAKNLAEVPPPDRRRVFLLDRPGAPQSVILAGQLVAPRRNPLEIAQATFNTVLGGEFHSRVNMNLREAKHWSYGAYTHLLDTRGPRPFLAIAPVQTDKTAEAVTELARELSGIGAERPVTAEELAQAKTQRTVTLAGRWETAGAVASSLAQIVRFGFPDRYFDDYAARVRGLGLADLAEAGRMLDPEHLTWVVVGDRAKVEAGLRALSLGEPALLDAAGQPAR